MQQPCALQSRCREAAAWVELGNLVLTQFGQQHKFDQAPEGNEHSPTHYTQIL